MMGKLGERWERKNEEREREDDNRLQLCVMQFTQSISAPFLPHSLLLYVFLFFLIFFFSSQFFFLSSLSPFIFLPDFFVLFSGSSSLLSSFLLPSPLHPIIVEENSLLVVMTVTSSVCDPNCHDHALNGMKGRNGRKGRRRYKKRWFVMRWCWWLVLLLLLFSSFSLFFFPTIRI